MTVQTLLKNDEPHLKVRATAPEWFDWAIGQPCESRTVAVECCDIHYLRWRSPVGRAPKRGILFIHGGGAHANWWRFVAPFFAEDYRVAAIDLSGMGDSGRREKYTSSQRAREIREVLSDADLGEQPFIVGHSFGGFMTVQFGVDYGDQIAGAIIADTPIRRPDDPPPGRAQRIFNYTRTYPTFERPWHAFVSCPRKPAITISSLNLSRDIPSKQKEMVGTGSLIRTPWVRTAGRNRSTSIRRTCVVGAHISVVNSAR